MKCISLWQPWASLVVSGAKRIETRGWYSGYRGPLMIHAAKQKSELYFAEFPNFAAALGPVANAIPLGCLLGVVDMVDCRKAESFTEEELTTEHNGVTGWCENQFGNFAEGRYGWVFDNPRAFEYPIIYKGQQGFFDVPDDIESNPPELLIVEPPVLVHPFDTGTQFADWEMRNCDTCWKSYTNQPRQRKDGKSKCEMDYALGRACMGNGKVTQEVADRIGYKTGANLYTWDCPEREEVKPVIVKPKETPKTKPGRLSLLGGGQ